MSSLHFIGMYLFNMDVPTRGDLEVVSVGELLVAGEGGGEGEEGGE
jgi:hypothetical protein